MTVMHMTKNVGKPYEGKLHVRFDEGELKVKQRPAKESLLEISSLLYKSGFALLIMFLEIHKFCEPFCCYFFFIFPFRWGFWCC